VYPEAVRLVLFLVLMSVSSAAGTNPRPSAASYSVRAVASHAEVGADYSARAFDSGTQSIFTGDYLVFEVAVFPEKGPAIPVAPGDFRLRLNNATREWSTVTAATVATSIRNPDFGEYRRGVEAGGGIGPGEIIIGRPRTIERFPGDPQSRVPQRPQVEDSGKTSPTELAARAATELALAPVKADSSGVSGLIYFYWRGKLKDLKRIELIYEGAGGKVVLRLR